MRQGRSSRSVHDASVERELRAVARTKEVPQPVVVVEGTVQVRTCDGEGPQRPFVSREVPDLNNPGGELVQTNKILPEPARFIQGLPLVSVIRPSTTAKAGAVATIKSFTADLLFEGQSKEFLAKVMALAEAADAAQRRV
jgi:hypothetical protein